MKNSTYNKKFILKKWRHEYYNHANINLLKYFNEKELEVLKKLEIEIESKLYTEHEFEMINCNLLKYYEHSENGELLQSEILTKKNIDKKELENILNKFNKIAIKYKI